ncbi:hypothetical protein J7K91_00065, partial [bacterium]|nr:hypothetical protein [bacterium]
KKLEEELEKILKKEEEKYLGEFEVIKVFSSQKKKKLVGGKVTLGEVKLNFEVEIFRGEEKIGEGKIVSLRKFKEDIKSAKEGEEIGMLLETQTEIKEKDLIKVKNPNFKK